MMTGMFDQEPLKTNRGCPQKTYFSPDGRRARRHAQDVSRAAEEFRAILRRERALAYRLHYRFSFLTLQVADAGRDGSEIETLVPAFRRRLRETDVVGVLGPDTLGAILPQTTVAQARRIVCAVCRAGGDACAQRRCRVSEYSTEDVADPSAGAGGDDRTSVAAASDAAAMVSEEERPAHAVDAILSGRVPVWKRVLDVSVAGGALLALSPLLALIALLIKVVSPGPILFRQARIGHLGRSFQCLKFRSMHVNSDSALHARHLQALICDGRRQLQKLDTQIDPRIIPMGRIFRASGLDELPQLINVLRGEMSLVGPRPCVAYEFRQFKAWHKRRCETPPGLTGFWQVNGKNKTTFNQMMRFDLEYVQKRTLAHDVASLLRTPAVVAAQIFEVLLPPRFAMYRRGASFARQ